MNRKAFNFFYIVSVLLMGFLSVSFLMRMNTKYPEIGIILFLGFVIGSWLFFGTPLISKDLRKKDFVFCGLIVSGMIVIINFVSLYVIGELILELFLLFISGTFLLASLANNNSSGLPPRS